MPCTEHGTPSRNGITRTRSQRGAKNANASLAPASSTTHRTKLPPPLTPSRASPLQTVPSRGSTTRAAAAARSAAASVGTTRDGATGTPAAAQSESTSILSSSAAHRAGRPPSTGRPSSGSSDSTNGGVSQTPSRPGSKASMAATASAGRVRATLSSTRTSSVIDAVAGVSSSTA